MLFISVIGKNLQHFQGCQWVMQTDEYIFSLSNEMVLSADIPNHSIRVMLSFVKLNPCVKELQ